MSEIEHPSEDDHGENISLFNSTLGFSVSAVIAFVGMFVVLIYNHNGGF
jgi:hypothetical protein